jgi:hypothetical protein
VPFHGGLVKPHPKNEKWYEADYYGNGYKRVHHTPVMKKFSLITILSVVVLLLVFAGCTQAPVTPPATATPTTSAPSTTAPVTTAEPATMGTPGPTQTLPPEYSLTFQVQTNGRTTDPLTYVGINGGNGMNFVTDVEAILTKPDGTSQSQIMSQPHYSGQNVSFPCSTWQNRVQIWTTAPDVGKIKVYDEVVPFK